MVENVIRSKTDREAIGFLNSAYLLMSLPAKNTDWSSPQVIMSEWILFTSLEFDADDSAFDAEEMIVCRFRSPNLQNFAVIMRRNWSLMATKFPNRTRLQK